MQITEAVDQLLDTGDHHPSHHLLVHARSVHMPCVCCQQFDMVMMFNRVLIDSCRCLGEYLGVVAQEGSIYMLGVRINSYMSLLIISSGVAYELTFALC